MSAFQGSSPRLALMPCAESVLTLWLKAPAPASTSSCILFLQKPKRRSCSCFPPLLPLQQLFCDAGSCSNSTLFLCNCCSLALSQAVVRQRMMKSAGLILETRPISSHCKNTQGNRTGATNLLQGSTVEPTEVRQEKVLGIWFVCIWDQRNRASKAGQTTCPSCSCLRQGGM